MRKLPVVSAFALLLVNPCLSIAATKPTQISTFCRNELQKTSYDKISLLTNDLYSMISNGQVESSITQINKIIDIALTSKSKSLSDDLGRLLGDDFTWRQNSHIERLIKMTPTAKRSLILPMLDNISGRIQSLDAGYSSMKIKALTQLASIYHSLGAKDKASILLNQAVQISSGVRLTEMRANLLTRIAGTYIDIGQPKLGQNTLAQSYQVALQFDKETKDKKREFHPSLPIAYTYAKLGNFERALDVAKSISNRLKQDEALGAIANQYIKINQLEQAQKLVPAIISEREKAKLLGQLAIAYSRSKNLNLADQLFNQAVKFASANIENDFILSGIIVSYAQAGQIDTASRALELVHDNYTKGNLHLVIANEYRKQNQQAASARSLEAMVALAQQQDVTRIESSIQTAIEISNINDYHSLFNSLLIKLKARPESLDYLVQVALRHNQIDFAYLIAQTIDNPQSHQINRLLPRIAVGYEAAKQPEKAIQAALKANNVSIMPYQVYGLAQTATAFQKTGQTVLAETTFNQAIQNANALSDTKLRAVALTIIAREYNSVGQKQLGQQFLTQAIQTAKSYVAPDKKEKTELVDLILYMLHEAKQFEQELQVAIEINNPELNLNFSGIAIGALRDGQDDLALKAAQFETNKKLKTRSLIDIAKFQMWRQHKSIGIGTLAQALLVAQTIPQDNPTTHNPYTDSRASLLEEIALLYAQIGQNKQALQVAMAQNASEINRVKQRISCY
ncbi:hypothetical protein RIVM261_052010 [Rivularia sp. IAM M-261]|nr:hypothetical protein RIVM261_052010 [Rivularia sp. IAM M-261]